jgi:multiple sugar transport system permease protein
MWGIVGLILLVSLFPFWWVVRTALIDPQEVYTNTTALFPENPTLFNFARALGMVDLQDSLARGGSGQTLHFWLYLRNSFVVATTVTAGQVFFSSLAAYAFARLHFPLRNQIFFLFVTGLMIPGIVLLIPQLHPDPELRLDRHVSGDYCPFLTHDPAERLFHAAVLPVAKYRD